MRVIVAKNAGFCMGVRRAMDIVLDAVGKASGKEEVYTDGPLIHNPQVLEFLEQKGISILMDTTNAADKKVVIRAHGIAPSRRKEIEGSGAKVCDATCPNVKSVQSIIKKYASQGYFTIIIGDEGHAEVDGLLGYSEGRGLVIQGVDDLNRLPAVDKVCVVSQTTQNRSVFKQVAEEIRQRYKECKIFETICNSTSKRQEEVVELSGAVDAVVVVGGRGSANTRRLAEISASRVPTFLIETEDELEMERLKDFETIGVTAGASTPNWMINRVVDKIQSYEWEKGFNAVKHLKGISRFLIDSCLYLCIGAGFMSYSNSILMGIEPKISFCVIAGLFVFSLYILNNLVSKKTIAFNDPQRFRFYEKYRNIFLGFGIAGAVFSITFAFFISLPVFLCLFFAAIFGVIYRLHIIPKRLSKVIKYNSLGQVPGSKEIFSSIAWAVCTVLIIFMGNQGALSPTLAVSFVFTMAVSFIRGVFLDTKDMQGDKIIGRETIAVVIGKEKTKLSLAIIAIFTAVLLIVSPAIGWTSGFSYYLLPCLAYASGYLYLYHRRIIKEGLLCEASSDFNFILAGIMGYIWRINL